MRWRAAFLFAMLLTLSGVAAQHQNYVRVTMHCDRDVVGSASVNLYANNVFVNQSPTEIFCGDLLVIQTTARADAHATTASLTTPDGPAFCTMPVPQPLPDTVICTANSADRHSSGATIRLHNPK